MQNNKTLLASVALSLMLAGCAGGDLKTAKRAEAMGDIETARQNYQQLAEFGIPEAQVGLANLTLKNRPTPAQAREAIKSLEASAPGNATVSMKLGEIYEKGQGVPKNLKLAANYYQQAFDLGNTKAAYKLANVYFETPANHAKAKDWFLKSLELGETKSALRLGRLYERGNIRDKNQSKALGYYLYAQDLGVTGADSSITQLKAKLSKQAVASGESFHQQLKSGVPI